MDLLQTLFHPLPNAVMTILMIIIVVYWLFALIGGLGLDDLDLGFDFDADVDAGFHPPIDINSDADADVDAADSDADGDASSGDKKSGNFFVKFLSFMNVGKVPFMLVFSTLKLFMWIGTLLTTSFVNVTIWGWQSIFILIPIGFICVFLTRYATNPLVKLFKEIGYHGELAIEFLGRSGKMLSSIKGDKIGSAEFMIENNPMRLNVVSHDGEQLNYGDFVVISDESDDGRIYYVTKEISIRNL